ncbi:hypothetical protein ACFZB4_18630 [Streptomyces pseudovenezuelae]|uniref:hypothetical protein n=1 Tax=Streptomyces pseudovenezuelae TaxID=67350 RepID=UPI0036E4336B
MPISLRAAALRTALERVLGEPVHALSTDRGVRVHAPAPTPDDQRWAQIYSVLRTGDVWGSSNTPMGPEVWAEIHEVNA